MAALGRYIVMLGSAGVRIALTLAELHRDEVQQRFPKHLLKTEKELRGLADKISAIVTEKELPGAAETPEDCVLLRNDEIFPALWKLAEGRNAGLDAELRKIPISQFVIEICELFDVNPYVNMDAIENKKCFQRITKNIPEVAGIANAVSGILFATDEPDDVLTFAKDNQIPAAVIGRLTKRNERVVRNGAIIRYLTPEG